MRGESLAGDCRIEAHKLTKGHAAKHKEVQTVMISNLETRAAVTQATHLAML